MPAFKDHFSRQAAAYSRHRPGYPPELIAHVAALAPDRDFAIDCATGSGQAAVSLAAHFAAVLAVDGSHSQLLRARRHPRVCYATALAEALPAHSSRAALVVAAQAAHWFGFARFYAECRRVLVPDGVVAAWTYAKFRIDASIDAAIDAFHERQIGAFWPPERAYVEQGYRTLPFPFIELATPAFELTTEWTLGQVMGYLATWSAVQRCKEKLGTDPLPGLEARLRESWPEGRARRVRWPMHLRIGRV